MMMFLKSTSFGKIPFNWGLTNLQELENSKDHLRKSVKKEVVRKRIMKNDTMSDGIIEDFFKLIKFWLRKKYPNSIRNIKNMRFPIPTESEQFDIIKKIEVINKEIELSKKRAEFLNKLLVSVLNKLWNNTLRFTNIEKFLSSDSPCEMGIFPSVEKEEFSFPFITSDFFRTSNSYSITLNEVPNEKKFINKGDILIRLHGSPKAIIYTGEVGLFHRTLLKINMDETIINKNYFINLLNFSVRSYHSIKLIKSLTVKELLKLNIPIVGKREQKKYGTLFSAIQQETELIKKKIIYLEELKVSTFDFLLIGRFN
ncbi:restriction endonuclease subunit S, partial [bacterium]|nr:restriction endonuclease subunit S [bacterium]